MIHHWLNRARAFLAVCIRCCSCRHCSWKLDQNFRSGKSFSSELSFARSAICNARSKFLCSMSADTWLCESRRWQFFWIRLFNFCTCLKSRLIWGKISQRRAIEAVSINLRFLSFSNCISMSKSYDTTVMMIFARVNERSERDLKCLMLFLMRSEKLFCEKIDEISLSFIRVFSVSLLNKASDCSSERNKHNRLSEYTIFSKSENIT